MVDLLERRCPTCGPTTAEPHPNQPGVLRCANCKEHHPTRPLPLDRLRILVDRAARHLTPAEGTALREALAGTVHNATTAVEGLHQRAADAEARAERAEQQLANVRAFAVQMRDWCSPHGIARDYAARIEETLDRAAALDGAQQPEPAGEDGHAGACPNPAAHVEVRDPCPLCDGAPLFARQELAAHLRERHGGSRQNTAQEATDGRLSAEHTHPGGTPHPRGPNGPQAGSQRRCPCCGGPKPDSTYL